MKKALLTRQNKLCLLTCFFTLFCTLQPWNASAQTYPFVKQTDIDETLWAGNYIIAFYDPSDPNNQYAFNATPVNTDHFSIGTQIQLSADFNTIENIGTSKIVSVEYGGQYKEEVSTTGIPAGTHYYYISYEKDGERYYISGGNDGTLTLSNLSARPLTSSYRWFFYKEGDDFFIRNCYGKIWLRAVTSQHKIHLHNAVDNNQPIYLYRWTNDNYHEINITSAGMGVA